MSTPKMNIAHHTEGPTTARAASSTMIPGRAMVSEVIQLNAASSQPL